MRRVRQRRPASARASSRFCVANRKCRDRGTAGERSGTMAYVLMGQGECPSVRQGMGGGKHVGKAGFPVGWWDASIVKGKGPAGKGRRRPPGTSRGCAGGDKGRKATANALHAQENYGSVGVSQMRAVPSLL